MKNNGSIKTISKPPVSVVIVDCSVDVVVDLQLAVHAHNFVSHPHIFVSFALHYFWPFPGLPETNPCSSQLYRTLNELLRLL